MNQVPWLRSGTGRTPSEGGCILQVIDWIDRNQWTDHPPCVHPVLARLAIRANDNLDDEGRQKLLDLAPRLMGTDSDDPILAVRLGAFCARQVLHLYETEYPEDDRPRKAIEAAEAYDGSAANAAYAANTAANAAANTAAAANAANAAAYAANTAANAAANTAAAANAANAAAYAVAAAADAADVSPLSLLLTVLGEYERLVGPREIVVCDFGPVVEVMAGG